jgi:large subunit ribosomal protein L22
MKVKGKAIARFTRVGQRKVNQILDVIRGKSVSQSYKLLEFTKKAATPMVMKTLKSAVANIGKHVDENKIYVNETYAGQGPVLKRLRPMAMGRGAIYRRKTSHVTIIVGEQGK